VLRSSQWDNRHLFAFGGKAGKNLAIGRPRAARDL